MKYMGSKNRIAKHILPIILKDRKEGQWYVEPFVGGANCIDKVNGNRIGADSNFYLIEMLKYIQQFLRPPIEELSKEDYKNIKDNKEKYLPAIVGYVGINCSYSGKWFGGYAGVVKTKEGTRDYMREAYVNVVKQARDLIGIRFIHSNYNELEIPKNSIIYCDPPYANTTKYKDDFNHSEFWEWCRKMNNLGHTVFVSEYNAPSDFIEVWSKPVKSSLSANGKLGGNKNSIEKLFTINAR